MRAPESNTTNSRYSYSYRQQCLLDSSYRYKDVPRQTLGRDATEHIRRCRENEEEETAKTLDKLQSEVDRLNAPEEDKRLRMTASANALIAALPNVHGHLVRFYGDIQDHDPDTVVVLEEHIKLLQSLIEAHL